jgi:hypothetical protein
MLEEVLSLPTSFLDFQIIKGSITAPTTIAIGIKYEDSKKKSQNLSFSRQRHFMNRLDLVPMEVGMPRGLQLYLIMP